MINTTKNEFTNTNRPIDDDTIVETKLEENSINPEEQNSQKLKHDELFKKSLTYTEVAQDFFELHLPSSVSSLVNLDTLKLEKESFIEANLSHKFSDLLFSVSLNDNNPNLNPNDRDIDHYLKKKTKSKKGATRLKNDGSAQSYIYILLEHQSSNDSLMAFRLFKYMLCICDHHLAQYKTKQLPLVYPMVFYNAKKKYTASKNIWDLFTNPVLAKSWWNNDHHFVNVQQISDSKLKDNYLSGMMQYFLKHIYEDDLIKYWQNFAPQLKIIASMDIGYDYIYLMLNYTLTKIDKNDNIKLKQIITDSLTQEQGDKFMTSLAHHWMEEGLQKGIEKGLQKGKAEGLMEGIEKGKAEQTEMIAMNMLKQNADLPYVSGVTGLSLTHLNKLKKSISTN